VLALGSLVLVLGGAAALSLATAPTSPLPSPPITQAERTACFNVTPVSPDASVAFL